ncbi:OsmC family protein [Psychroflexus sp. ALD_RP9]|uniref:OsmC family protein n=1 Tax=Psychroflexus sp. ALD_RP9 TaxID=2777186 RepID=UPI001A8F5502|nr:OsmC family protein [Psychroflexus sp. ALD_RP9]QSS96512.1 OsmC family protein [Psychroflexus sp. ALD_RP9]
MEDHIYNVEIKWLEQRKGKMYSPELHDQINNNSNEIEVATPTQFNGGMPFTWSPEHLFTAAVSSCLMTTFLAIAEHSKLNYSSFKCPSKGFLNKVDGRFAMHKVELYPEICLKKNRDKKKAEKVLEKSKKACLISNSVISKIEMHPRIIVIE